MTKEAFQYALQHAPVPQGKTLWLYGNAPISHGDVYTPYKDKVTAFEQRGLKVFSSVSDITDSYDAVIVHCPKQQEETEGLLALAFARSKGFIMAIAANDAGGNRLAKLFAAYGVESQQLSKDRCKIVYITETSKANQPEVKRNLALLTPHKLEMEGKNYWTVPGLFGWNKIDIGSRLLTEHLPVDLGGKAADFGCGFGYLSAYLAEHAPGVISIDAYDLDARAVDLTIRNAGAKTTAIWQDMRVFTSKPVYDVVVMNPPFHSGKDEDIGLGEGFIRSAWASLRTGGRLFMVANRNLPYEQIVPQLKEVFAGQGYKVMAGRKP